MNTPHNKAKKNTAQELDPNVLQRQASDPDSNVWVNASAGTGKTKVLTDRVLRLLLPDENDNDGAMPHKILCLTFTKAAAAEMLARINKTLGQWSILSEDLLNQELKQLLGEKPTSKQIEAAQKLFSKIINVPGGMKIMTIHAFCQSTLSKFPLEATLSPQTTVMEEAQAKTMLQNAADKIIVQTHKEKGSPLAGALHAISSEINEDQFLQLIQKLASEHYQINKIIKENFGIDGLYNALCNHCQIDPNKTIEEVKSAACQNKNFEHGDLKNIAEILIKAKSKTDQNRGHIIAHFLSLPEKDRIEYFEEYTLAFLKKEDHAVRAKLATKPVFKSHPEAEKILLKEAERVENTNNKIKTIRSVCATRDLLILANTIIQKYDQAKEKQGMLDYNDLINKTLDLMDKFPGWVMYKLDSGIDHILVDEAQDTNPEQWQIIEKLCAEFYTHLHDNDASRKRTLFIVGDEKQSIYSFQRASPEEFYRMHEELHNRVRIAKQKWSDVNLNISFRSTQAILDIVDAVFIQESTPISKKRTHIHHKSFRRGQAGRVEMWPLFESDENDEDFDIWTPPITAKNFHSGSTKLANFIAKTIKEWLDNKEQLPSHNRAIKPSDIMILVKSRTTLVHQITKALKALNIPVNGVDRMVLNNEIVIQDLMALIRFTQTPNDDLNLACLLKSPIIGIDEETLFELAYNRTDSLWNRVQETANNDIVNYLKQSIGHSHLRPYEFLNLILNTQCPADKNSALTAIKNRLGEDVSDPINELLSMAIDYEQNNIPSLGAFFNWIMNDEKTIKRELESTNNQVRIMTVHGAKGLQAPIVIMPDTILSTSKATNTADRFLMPDKSGIKLPLYSPKKKYDHTIYKDAQKNLKTLEEQEYNRLLYVAMTRAEDRLYIGGCTATRKPQDSSWYFKIKSALERQEQTRTDTYGNITFETPQTANADRVSNDSKTKEHAYDALPKWASEEIQKEKEIEIITPSKSSLSDTETTTANRSNRSREEARQRGLTIHKLLEILPNIPKENRQKAAKNMTADQQIIDETLNIINDPTFAALFSAEALAEVPIIGKISEKTVINGIIDRLLVTDKNIWLIDYKSGATPNKIPSNYQKQMNAYAQALMKIYPDKTIQAALLWTEGPTLMPVTIDPQTD